VYFSNLIAGPGSALAAAAFSCATPTAAIAKKKAKTESNFFHQNCFLVSELNANLR